MDRYKTITMDDVRKQSQDPTVIISDVFLTAREKWGRLFQPWLIVSGIIWMPLIIIGTLIIIVMTVTKANDKIVGKIEYILLMFCASIILGSLTEAKSYIKRINFDDD